MPASPVGEGRQVTSATLLFNSLHYFIKENLYCPFFLSNVPNGQILIFLGRGNERPGKWLCSPSGASTASSGGACWIQSLWAAKISGLNFIWEMHKAWELVTVSELGCCQLPVTLLRLTAGPGVFPPGKARGPAECHFSLLHIILLVKLSRKLPVRRLGVEGHTEFNPIKTSLAFPHSWYLGSN